MLDLLWYVSPFRLVAVSAAVKQMYCEILRTHLICYGLGKFAEVYLRSIAYEWEVNPVILIFELGLVRYGICKVVGFNIEDGVDAIEARVERQLWQKKNSTQTNKICKQSTHFVAMCVASSHPPPAYQIASLLCPLLPT